MIVLGSTGYVALGLRPLDAAYQTVTTVFAIGFREVVPFDTPAEQISTIARSRTDDAEPKFVRAGANRVVNPQRSGGLLLALRTRGHFITNPSAETGFGVGDVLNVVGTDVQVQDLHRRAHA